MSWGLQVSFGVHVFSEGSPIHPGTQVSRLRVVARSCSSHIPKARASSPPSLPLQSHCTCLTALSSTYTLAVDTPNSCLYGQSQLSNLIIILSKTLLPLECSDLPWGEGLAGLSELPLCSPERWAQIAVTLLWLFPPAPRSGPARQFLTVKTGRVEGKESM